MPITAEQNRSREQLPRFIDRFPSGYEPSTLRTNEDSSVAVRSLTTVDLLCKQNQSVNIQSLVESFRLVSHPFESVHVILIPTDNLSMFTRVSLNNESWRSP